MDGGGGREYQEEKSSPIFTGKAKGGTLDAQTRHQLRQTEVRKASYSFFSTGGRRGI